MEILVCVKRVPDTAENEIEINGDGTDIEQDDLVYSVNEWDNYAVEEAIQIVTRSAAASPWSPWATTRPKRCCAVRWPWVPTTACFCFRRRLRRFRRPRHRHPSQGGGKRQLRPDPHRRPGRRRRRPGGRHAGRHAGRGPTLRWSTRSTSPTGDKLTVGREIEGGNQEMNEMPLPCVLSIQTGINEPRYVGIRGIRKVASVEIPEMGAGDRRRPGAEAPRSNAWTTSCPKWARAPRCWKAARRDHRQTD
jgi:electron transfer flavoprotein beta subunit